VRKRRSARTGRRPRKFGRHSSTYLLLAVCVDKPPLRAARANRVFRADEKRIRTENTVMVNTKRSAGVLSEIADWARMCFSSVPNR
jgi:hypothetical protein